MGWSGGSDVASRVGGAIQRAVDGGKLDRRAARAIVDELVEVCRDLDCDTLYELEGESEILDEVLRDRGEIGAEEE